MQGIWLTVAALTMGGGIWSMHFVAMLAFVLPMPMSYDIGLTVLSLMLAILITSGGFYVISRPGISRPRLVLSGVFMGLGILAMRSEEHTSELQSLMRISYAVFCLKKKTQTHTTSTMSTSIYNI